MAEDNTKKVYFEREHETSHFRLNDNPDYRFFAQEEEEIDLEVEVDS